MERKFTVEAEEAYYLCFQYSKYNRIFIGFGFLFMKKSLNILIHSGVQEKAILL